MFYKNISGNYIVSVSTGCGQTLIAEDEYDKILLAIRTMPKAPKGYRYRLNKDLQFELHELPPAPPEPPEAEPEDYQSALNRLGVET